MIKCNVTVCGVIGRDASIRTNKEGKTFLVFPLRVMIPDTDGKTMPIEVDVSKDTAGKEVSKYRNGSRIEVSGTMYLKHRGDKLYFNLFINEIRTATYNPQNEMFRLLGTKRSFSQNETFFFSHPYPLYPALFRLISHF